MSKTTILLGAVQQRLAELPDESVNCCVTSPPYWGLRDYGVDGQIGLEPSLGEHLAVLVEVFRDIRRVMRKDGTLWLNYGDSYATAPNGRSAADTKAAGNDDRTFRDKPFSTIGPIHRGKRIERGNGRWGGWNNSSPELKSKDLCMAPNRLAIALQEDGWWVRSEIIWSKPNPMPESTKDRPIQSHEKVWLMSRSARYYYDYEAVRQEATYGEPNAPDKIKSPHGQGFTRRARQRGLTPRHAKYKTGNRKLDDHPRGKGRSLRNVWEISTRPFDYEMCLACESIFTRIEHRGLERYEDENEVVHVICTCGRDNAWLSHFATFPPQLIEPCIASGCPLGGVVLDPFGGAGTTALVANRLGRDAILIELKPEYAKIARRRLQDDAAMFSDVDLYEGERPWPQPTP